MHQIQPDALLHEGIVLNLNHKKSKEYIRGEDLKEAEKKSGATIRQNDVVLIRTAWDLNLGKPEYLTSYPGLSKDAADFLVSKKIAAAGVDSPNIDHPEDSTFPAHTTLLSNEILVLENLYNVRGIQKTRFRFVALPLRLQGATGSPIRAVAIED
jgi:kynurenine formamidase